MPEESISSLAWGVVSQRYAQFHGRATRREYWSFQLYVFVITIVLAIAFSAVGSPDGGHAFIAFLGLGIVIPQLALTVRRLHDIDKSAWWLLLYIIPFGALVLLIFACLPSAPGRTDYD